MVKLNNFDKRKQRVSNSIRKNNKNNRLRFSVFKSNKYISIQIIDDLKRETLISASTRELAEKLNNKCSNINAAKLLGKLIADKIKKKKLKNLFVFDKGPYKYHGAIKSLADCVREELGAVL